MRDPKHMYMFLISILAGLWLATSASAQTYDLLDYMIRDDGSASSELKIDTGDFQQIRSYCVNSSYQPITCNSNSGRFLISKNIDWNQGGVATEFEEYEYDQQYIYLVRDTSWQSANWCGNNDTSFELWQGGQKRGRWLPRYVSSNTTLSVGGFDIVSRREDTCRVCRDPQKNQSRTLQFTYLGWKWFDVTGVWLGTVLEVKVTGGPGAGERYYFDRYKGWVGYEEWSGSNRVLASHYKGALPGILPGIKDPCVGGGCGTGASSKWYHSGNFYHQTGSNDGYDWSARVNIHNPGFLIYGPYDPSFGQGNHTAWYLLQIDNNSGSDVVASIDVTTRSGQLVLAQRNIRRNEFNSTYSWQWFPITFKDPCFDGLEARLWWNGSSYLKFGQMYIFGP